MSCTIQGIDCVDTGGSASGQSYSQFALETLDITSGWTKVTKDTLAITGESYSSGSGTYTMSAVSADPKYTIQQASYPVAYRQAYALDASGNPVNVTTDDDFVLNVRFTNFRNEPDYRSFVVFGLTTDPTATSANNFSMMGFAARLNKSGSFTTYQPCVVGGNNFMTFGTTAADKFTGQSIYKGSLLRQVVSNGIASLGSSMVGNAGSRQSSKNRTAGQPLYMVFGIANGNNTTSVVEGETVGPIKIEYRGVIHV